MFLNIYKLNNFNVVVFDIIVFYDGYNGKLVSDATRV